jgi:predicted amidohydrolase
MKTPSIQVFVGACLLVILARPSAAAPSDGLRVELKDFSTDGHVAAGWSSWAQRPEVQPRCFVDSVHFRSAPDALAISGDGNAVEYGGWAYTVGNVIAGRTYQLTAHYRTQAVPDERRQVVARIDWLDASGKRVGQPDYAYETSAEGDWTRVKMKVPSPPGSASVRLEFSLGWAPQGTVWWDDILFEETTPPPARWVRVGTISLHPRNSPDNVGAFLEAIDAIAPEKPDIVCLGEEIVVEGSSRSYASAAEPIPGPSTARIGERARKYGMYIVAGLTEKDGNVNYNTAVLIDRNGNVAGKYRKVFLPREEIEGGLTPGSAYPVFDTDFGRIGMLICWDAEYVDAARAMAIQGAEIILVPAAGGYLTLLKARALENHLYVVSSGFDVESSIINPRGEVLFATMDSGVDKVMAVDLQERLMDPWEGDMRSRFHKEYRTDIPIPGSLGK